MRLLQTMALAGTALVMSVSAVAQEATPSGVPSGRSATIPACRSSASPTISRPPLTSATGIMTMQKGKVVESGAAREVLDHPRHPHSIRLKSSVLTPDSALETAPGP